MADNWLKVANAPEDIQFNEKGIAEIQLDGLNICLIKQGSKLYACKATCPHAGARFAENAFINNKEQIVCCVHNYRFSLNTGRDAMNEGYFLKLYEVRVANKGIYIKLS